MPYKAKPDAIMQTSVDRRDLAVIALFLQKKNRLPRNRSDLLRSAVEMIAQVLINSGEQEIISTEQATEILERLGIVGLNPNHRLARNLVENLQAESLLDEEPEEIKDFNPPKKLYEEDRSAYADEKGKVPSLDYFKELARKHAPQKK